MKMIRFNDPTNYFNDWDSFFVDPFRAFAPLLAQPGTSAFTKPGHAVEWYEDDEHFHARIELPGVAKNDLHLDAEDGLVRLSYERENCSSEGSQSGTFERFLRTPEGTDISGVEAKLVDGILELSFPKTPERKPVSIQIS